MLSRRLRRYEVFAELAAADLDAAAAAARVLRLPARRWLVRPGREITGWYFLLRGRVRLCKPDGIVDASSVRARGPLYPGARGVFTESAAEFVRVDTDPFAHLSGVHEEPLPPLYETVLDTGWEHRFLHTGVLRMLTPVQWQRLLRAMRPGAVPAGAPVIREGDPGIECFVLCSGTAEVRVRGSLVARLGEGDFFGEDALITGKRRNATVVMTAPGRVMALPAPLFLDEILSSMRKRALAEPRASISLDVGGVGSSADLCIPVGELRDRLHRLDGSSGYRIVGGSMGERELAAFILLQRGVRVSLDLS